MFAQLIGLRSWPIFLAVILLLPLAGCDKKPVQVTSPSSRTESSAAPINERAIAEFLDSYWLRPLSPQDKFPGSQQNHAVNLAPESCGACHVSQYQDWSKSLHSHAMGPGILGQLVDMPPHAREDHQNCIRCHAPLAEQANSLVAALEKKSITHKRISSSQSELHDQGVICAACHVRNYQWNGPLRRDGSQPEGDLSAYPHGGWKGNPAFESSLFCAACHQFKAGEYSLNGKLMENTYQEWLNSSFAKQGVACQSCHMPERRHLWRGIHDAGMTQNGLNIRAEIQPQRQIQLLATLRVKNTGVGHDFPTYVTPHVVMEGYQIDARGKMLASTYKQYLIARQVKVDMSEEIADTRLAPGQETVFSYQVARDARAVELVLRVRVEPDAFYTEFYHTMLDGNQTNKGRKMLEMALDHSKSSSYILYEKKMKLPMR